jgi:hypothetical protein
VLERRQYRDGSDDSVVDGRSGEIGQDPDAKGVHKAVQFWEDARGRTFG